MQSFVARLRARAVSQSTTISTQSDEPLPHTPDTPTFLQSTLSALQASHVQTTLDRKINPHVNELMESYAAEPSEPIEAEEPSSARESAIEGLSPRPFRKRAVRQSTTVPEETPSDIERQASASQPGSDGRSDSPDAPSEGSSAKGKSSFARLSHRLASSARWSTFGRSREPTPTRLVQPGPPPSSSRRFHFGSTDTFAIPRRSRSSRSVAVFTMGSATSVDHIRQTSRASESSSWMQPQSIASSHRRSFSFNAFPREEYNNTQLTPSPPATTSSRKNSTKHSVTTRSSFSTQSQIASVHTPVMQTFDVNSSSPRTFGQASPQPHSAFVTSVSPPPPLPPLEHPELVAALATRSQPTIRDLSNTIATPSLRHWPSLHGKTFPPRRRRNTEGSRPDENSYPFTSTLGRHLRSHSSMPRIQSLFDQQPRSRRDLTRHRSSSVKSSRRSSADWSAHQASVGVLSDSHGYGWPAEVSKEIIRLSVQGGDDKDKALGASECQPGAANAGIRQRVRSVPAQDSRLCPPLFSSSFSPHHIEGPSESGDKSSWPQSQKTDHLATVKPGEDEGSMSVRNGAELSTLREDDDDDNRQPATVPRAAGARPYRKSILRQSSPLKPQGPEAGPSTLQQTPPSTPSRRSSLRYSTRHSSEPTLSQVLETPTKKGKRKAEDVDLTPPDARTAAQHTTFVIPPDRRRTHHVSEPSGAPSAYQRKRVRLSESSPAPSPSHSRPGSALQNASNVGSTPNRTLPPPSPAMRAISRAASARSMQASVASGTASATGSRRDRRRSTSEISFPIGAIVSPQPPSLSRSSTYHMRDPRRPPPIHPTPWAPHLKTEDEPASSAHAWCFFIGFILFPLWWIASFLPIPRTRHMGGSDTEKAVPLDDPQVEHDARSWRKRCRIMSGITVLTYIPFVVLVAIFASR